MGRYLSQEQKKDLKVRLVVGSLLTALGVVVYAVGPGLQHVLAHARAHKEEEWAPKRYYHVAKIMEWTGREEQAQEVYQEFYIHYCGIENIDDDRSEELFGEVQWDPDWWYYCPWVEARFDPEQNPRPRPLSVKRHPLLGPVLVDVAKYYEGRRLYIESNHIYTCLQAHWQEGSFEHQEGVAGWRRAMQRSF